MAKPASFPGEVPAVANLAGLPRHFGTTQCLGRGLLSAPVNVHWHISEVAPLQRTWADRQSAASGCKVRGLCMVCRMSRCICQVRAGYPWVMPVATTNDLNKFLLASVRRCFRKFFENTGRFQGHLLMFFFVSQKHGRFQVVSGVLVAQIRDSGFGHSHRLL